MAHRNVQGGQLDIEVNAQTGATYTIADTDRGNLITINRGTAVAITLPQAGAASSFLAGWFCWVFNYGAGVATITPTTSTISGLTSYVLNAGQSVQIFSDGANYQIYTSGFMQYGGNQVLASSDGSTSTPQFRALVGADIPVFVASGASHKPGGVPDPGAGAGTTKFLREDATFAVPAGGTTSPLTTKGDVWVYSTVDARLPVGTNGQVLSASSAQTTGLLWESKVSAATTTDQTTVTDDTTTNATMYPLWLDGYGAGGHLPYVSSSKLNWNPSTATLTATTFSGNATTATTATNATNEAITDDTTTNATMYPVWVTANTGNLPAKVSSSKLSWNPSIGQLALPANTASSSVKVGSLEMQTYAVNNAWYGENVFYDGATFKYRANGYGLTVRSQSGSYQVQVAVSGTAGGVVTLVEGLSITQAAAPQVKISGVYTLPTADGTANQLLSTDGAGAVTFKTVTAVGGGSATGTEASRPAA